MYLLLVLLKPDYSQHYYHPGVPDDLTAGSLAKLEGRAERTVLTDEEGELLADDFEDEIDDYTGALVGLGDSVHLDLDVCKKLIEWIKRNPQIAQKQDRKWIYDILLDYATRAVEGETAGLIISL